MTTARSSAEPIHHVTTADAWADAQASGALAPPSLDDEGFVHLSTAAQVDGVLRRFYAGRDDLVLLDVDPASLGEAGIDVRWEAPAHPDGTATTDAESAERYPHAYGAIPLGAVLGARRIPPVT